MPNETRYHVPKPRENIIAAPDRFRSRLSDIGNHPFFDTVPITWRHRCGIGLRIGRGVGGGPTRR